MTSETQMLLHPHPFLTFWPRARNNRMAGSEIARINCITLRPFIDTSGIKLHQVLISHYCIGVGRPRMIGVNDTHGVKDPGKNFQTSIQPTPFNSYNTATRQNRAYIPEISSATKREVHVAFDRLAANYIICACNLTLTFPTGHVYCTCWKPNSAQGSSCQACQAVNGPLNQA